MTEFENTLKNSEFVGIVEDNKDPDKKQRVRIRIPYLHGDASAIPTDAIPWAQPNRDNNGLSFSVPDLNKIVMVTFPTGNQYFPVYKNAVHLNINLQKKIEEYSDIDYTSFVALCYNHNAQIYFDNNNFYLKYKNNGLVISEEDIIIEQKNKNTLIKIGNINADQSMILGDNWYNLFVEFIDAMPNFYISSTPGNPTVATPELFKFINKFKSNVNKILSKNIKCVDNIDNTNNEISYEKYNGDNITFVSPTQNKNIIENEALINNQTVQDNIKKIQEEKNKELEVLTVKDSIPKLDSDNVYIQHEIETLDGVDSNYITEESDYYEYEYEYEEDEYATEDEYEYPTEYDDEDEDEDNDNNDIDDDSVGKNNSTSTTPVSIGNNSDLYFDYNNKRFVNVVKSKKYDINYDLLIDPTKLTLKHPKFIDAVKTKQTIEGGLSNALTDSASKNPKNWCPIKHNPKAPPYHTNRGITYSVWVSVYGKNQNERFLKMSDTDWLGIFKSFFKSYARYEKISYGSYLLLGMFNWGSPKSAQICHEKAEMLAKKYYNKKLIECKESEQVAILLSVRYIYFIRESNPGKNNNTNRNGWVNNALVKQTKLFY